MMFGGLMQMASKSSTRFGDGLAQSAMWKYMGPDYFQTGHVSSNKESIFFLNI